MQVFDRGGAVSVVGVEHGVRMVQPFRMVMTNGHSAFFILAGVTYVISLFFWPTPAVPLVSAVLLPAAIAAGLSPLAGAMAIAIAGQGMALSSDYVIGVAPGISAKAAGAAVSAAAVADRALILSLIVGGVALLALAAIAQNLRRPAKIVGRLWVAQDAERARRRDRRRCHRGRARHGPHCRRVRSPRHGETACRCARQDRL